MRQANSCEYRREQRIILKTSEIDHSVLWPLCMVTGDTLGLDQLE